MSEELDQRERDAEQALEAAQVRAKDLLEKGYELDREIADLREQKRELSHDLAGALEQHEAAQAELAEVRRQQLLEDGADEPQALQVELGPAIEIVSTDQ